MDHETQLRVRYAPSPTGLLHVGNLRTGLFAWLFTRQNGGAFILRIEDTDQARSEKRYETLIYDDLRWFGMDWDEGPDVGGNYGPYRQSERAAIYHEHAGRLLEGGVAFRCFCSEEELVRQAERARQSEGGWKYPGTCRGLTPEAVRSRTQSGEPFVVRLRVRDGTVSFEDIVHGTTQFSTSVLSDPILMRSDGTPTYNYAVVVDDALMNISHVIRGDDHLSNTPKQVLIYEALGYPIPAFAHLSTILGPDHTRLSKRHGATAVDHFRQAGYLSEALMNYLALLGWSPGDEGSEIVPPERLVREFKLERVNKNPAVFDFAKLDFINRHYLRESPKTPALVRTTLEGAGWLPESGDAEWIQTVTETLIDSVHRASDLPMALENALAFPVESSAAVAETRADSGALELIQGFALELARYERLTYEDFRSVVSALRERTGRKGRELFHPLRVALTARDSGPELDKLIPLIETAARERVRGVLNCRARVEKFLAVR